MSKLSELKFVDGSFRTLIEKILQLFTAEGALVRIIRRRATLRCPTHSDVRNESAFKRCVTCDVL